MSKPICIICGEKLKPNSNRITAALWHFRPLDCEQWAWFRGTLKHCGIRAAICLISPFCSTLLNWKYMKCKLTTKFNALEEL